MIAQLPLRLDRLHCYGHPPHVDGTKSGSIQVVYRFSRPEALERAPSHAEIRFPDRSGLPPWALPIRQEVPYLYCNPYRQLQAK